MLSRVNRITRAADFRATVRTGRKISSPNAVVYSISRSGGEPTRFGFIVSKAVGNSVIRHRVTRRLRAVGFSILADIPGSRDVIVRALPGSIEADWATLRSEIADAIARSAAEKGGARA